MSLTGASMEIFDSTDPSIFQKCKRNYFEIKAIPISEGSKFFLYRAGLCFGNLKDTISEKEHLAKFPKYIAVTHKQNSL